MKKISIIAVSIASLFLIGMILFFVLNKKNGLFTVMKVPDFSLTDQDNHTITPQTMLGKVYLVEFFYASCPTICPVMTKNSKEIEKSVNDSNFGVLSISIDPKRDTPQTLKRHKELLKITNPNWHFLTGNRDYIQKLADKFNIYVGDKENEAQSLNHSGYFALVDKQGNIRCRTDEKGIPILYYSGLNYSDEGGKKVDLKGKFKPEVEMLAQDVKKLLEE